MNNNATRLAQSASALGAGLLGLGIGAKWGNNVAGGVAIAAIVAGGLIHLSGMYITQMKNRPDKGQGYAIALWIAAWICLIGLIGLAVYLIMKKN